MSEHDDSALTGMLSVVGNPLFRKIGFSKQVKKDILKSTNNQSFTTLEYFMKFVKRHLSTSEINSDWDKFEF